MTGGSPDRVLPEGPAARQLGSSGRAVEQLPDWGTTPLDVEPLLGTADAMVRAQGNPARLVHI